MGAGDGSRLSEAARWMRNAHLAVCAFMGVCVLCGLGYLFYCAFLGQAFRAILGAIVAIGGVAAGFLALAIVRLGTLLVANREQTDLLASRMEGLENLLHAERVVVDLARADAGRAEELLAADLRCDGFPRLVPAESDTPCKEAASASTGATVPGGPLEHQWQAAFQSGNLGTCRQVLASLREVLDPERIASLEDGLHTLSRAKVLQLRQDFAGQVRSRDFASALITGKQITELFPDSDMAREFGELCPQLIERADRRKKSPAVSAV